ncbi:type VI secretion system-associated FHA domain protein TagH [Luteibacter aegosomatis]|uniref:type VI secretion system-associated FHA domain protein TagH n=1 Tax=Luteibacter aegosomatis TaxID=2911537 RepID=UPI001FF7FB5D|nr:type VI secretion system-associated FHA domain protein TagH [Luteibacter aegosomatis]UPG84792.1 type VI secretion system-associated FHA domain protein TagH [Luteibacter aegosomatis]
MNRDAGPILVLTVPADAAGDPGADASRRVEGHDLSIGRAEQCDWVLQARGVSRLHAQVRYLNGMYFVEDRSTNGMLFNGAPMRNGEPAMLRHGDRLRIDTFDIEVAIQAPADRTAPTTAPRVRPADDVTANTVAPVAFEAARVPEPVGPASMPVAAGDARSLDPLAWLSASTPILSVESSGREEPSPGWNHASPMAEHFAPPAVDARARPAAAVLPENWDRTRSLFAMPAAQETVEPSAPEPLPVVEPPVAAPVAAPAAAAEPVRPTTEAHALEPLFLRMLDGVMDVLRARAELKNGFRMPATLIRRTENNPLKFAPSAREAMSRLLAPPGEAFLSGEAAIVDAMDDIRLHQVALLAGVRAAFDDLVAQFDPDRFEDGAKRSRFGFGTGKGAWERYRAHFDGLAGDPDERFRRLFGDEFARAYEDQLASHKRGGKPMDDGR